MTMPRLATAHPPKLGQVCAVPARKSRASAPDLVRRAIPQVTAH
jgi:hypothetical protein